MSFVFEVYDSSGDVRVSSDGIVARVLLQLTDTFPSGASSKVIFLPGATSTGQDHFLVMTADGGAPYGTYTIADTTGGVNLTFKNNYGNSSFAFNIYIVVFRVL